nr:MAG TPA: hypothetical protein [Caudoviricetes sp.]
MVETRLGEYVRHLNNQYPKEGNHVIICSSSKHP